MPKVKFSFFSRILMFWVFSDSFWTDITYQSRRTWLFQLLAPMFYTWYTLEDSRGSQDPNICWKQRCRPIWDTLTRQKAFTSMLHLKQSLLYYCLFINIRKRLNLRGFPTYYYKHTSKRREVILVQIQFSPEQFSPHYSVRPNSVP